MSWMANLLTGTPLDILLIIGIPLLLVDFVCQIFLLIRDRRDERLWRKDRKNGRNRDFWEDE